MNAWLQTIRHFTSSLWMQHKRWVIGGIGTIVIAVAANLISLWFEHNSGYFQTTPSGPDKTTPEQQKTNIDGVRNVRATPTKLPTLQAKADDKTGSSKQGQQEREKSQSNASEPLLADVTFDHFAATYSSLSDRDRSPYIQSLVGKKVVWTGYISQIYLYQNNFYFSDKRDEVTDVNVAVDFKDDMRLNIGPVKSKIRVSGTVEIRQHWIVIHATELRIE
jgi:hypothetical protein